MKNRLKVFELLLALLVAGMANCNCWGSSIVYYIRFGEAAGCTGNGVCDAAPASIVKSFQATETTYYHEVILVARGSGRTSVATPPAHSGKIKMIVKRRRLGIAIKNTLKQYKYANQFDDSVNINQQYFRNHKRISAGTINIGQHTYTMHRKWLGLGRFVLVSKI